MKPRMSALVIVFLAAGVPLRPAVAAPASQPASPAATRPAPLDPAVERILDRLEKKKVEDVQADLVYTRIDPILEDTQKFSGILRFIDEKPNPRFFILFDKVEHEGIVQKKKEWHVFDGEWYTEAREKTQTIVKRQIVYPGEAVDAFKVGKGPFPLPFGQKKGDIVRHFAVKLAPPSPKDPKETKNSDHLECTPLPGTEMHRKYGKVHFYIDRKLDLPIYVKTVETEERNEISASFTKIKLNRKLARGQLDLPKLDYDETKEYLPPREGGGEKER